MPTLAYVVTAETEEAAASVKKFASEVGASVGEVGKGGKASFTELNSAVALAKQGIEAMKQVWDFAKQGAENERIAQSFEATAQSVGVSAEAMAAALDKAAKGTVDDEIFMQTATRNMALGVATSVQENVALMELARGASIKFGGDTETAFAGISEAIGNLQTRQLKQYGIIIDAKKVNEEYAKAIGKTADALTDAEQREALRNEVLKQSKQLVGDAGNAALTSAEKFKKFETQLANVADAAKQLAVDGFIPLLDRAEAANVMADEGATAQEKLAAAYTLADGKIGGRNGIYDETILKLEEQVRLERSLGMTVEEQSQRALMAKTRAFEVTRGAGDETVAAILAEEAAMKRAADTAALHEAATRRNADALAAQNAAALDAEIALGGLATSLAKNMDGSDVARAAIAGLQQQARDGSLTTWEYEAASRGAALATGLMTKESVAAAQAVERVNALYAAGKVPPEEYAIAIQKIPNAAKDGIVGLDELGLTVAKNLKKSKQDVLDEMGNAITSTQSEVSRAVDQSMRSVSTASSTAKSLVKGVGDAINALPEEKHVKIYIETIGGVPDLTGTTDTAPSGGAKKTSGPSNSGARIIDDLGSQVQAALNSGMGMAGI